MTSDLILSCRLILCGIKKIWSHINETESNCIEKKANSDNRVTPTVKKNNFPTSNQRLEEVDISREEWRHDGKRKLWRRRETAHEPKHTSPSAKHGGGNIIA